MSNKSEAAWHPNSGPATDHAGLIARLRRHVARDFHMNDTLIREAADALADSVPREQYDDLLAVARFTQSAFTRAQHDRDEARAERDALAHVIEQVRDWTTIAPAWNLISGEGAKAVVRIIDHAPVSLTRHDAEVIRTSIEAGLTLRDDGTYDYDSEKLDAVITAAAIRAEAE